MTHKNNKKSSQAGFKIKNQTVTGNGQQFADEINNQNTTGVHVEGNISGGNVAGGNIHITNYGIPLEKLIELSKKLGVVESERDAWMQKYLDLERQLANRSDEVAKQAKAFLDVGKLEEAERLFVQALEHELKKAQEATLKAAENAFSLAQIKDLQYQTFEAIRYYRQGLQLDPDNAGGWNRLGLVYQTRGDLDKAVEMFQKILKIHEELGSKEGLAADYGNLGLVYQTRGDLDKAVEMHNKALELNQALGRKEGIALNYGNLGNVYKIRGELDKAVEMYQKSLAITESLGDKEKMAAAYANLGNVYKLKGNQAEAKRYYQKSIELFKTIGSPNEKLVQGWLDDLK